jgi:hypothetical protein
LSPTEAAAVTRLALAADLERERDTIRDLVESIEELGRERAHLGDKTWSLATSFQLERFYTAVEALTVRALIALDGAVSTGPTWHADVLRVGSLAIDSLRPPILSPDSVSALRELLGFRHYARHGYDAAPRASKVEAIVRELPALHVALERGWDALDADLRAPR